MNKFIIALLLVMGVTACQQNNNQEIEVEPSNSPTKPTIKKITKYCTKDLKICPDGSSVSRNPDRNCEFNACAQDSTLKEKEAMMCTADVKQCPDGTFVSRDHYNNCQFKECPSGSELKKEI